MTNWIELLLERAERGADPGEELPAVDLTRRLLSGRPAAMRDEDEELIASGTEEFREPPGGVELVRTEEPRPFAGAQNLSEDDLTAAPYGSGRGNAALLRLYRRVQAETERSSPVSVRTVVHPEERPAAAPLTAEGFDRLICRDSRRYDGGMTIL